MDESIIYTPIFCYLSFMNRRDHIGDRDVCRTIERWGALGPKILEKYLGGYFSTFTSI